MNRIFLIFTGLTLYATSLTAQQQQTDPFRQVLTLEDAIQLAKEQSLDALIATHRFRSSYYSFMDHRATFLPRLSLETRPTTWEHSIRTILSVDDHGNVRTREARENSFRSTAGLDLRQNIGFTGGTISLGSEFSRHHDFLRDDPDIATQFTTIPIRLTISQPLNGYNPFRWSREIEPLRFEEAKLSYITQMERIAERAVRVFFDLAIAQVELNLAETSLKNNQDLYNLQTGRFQQGLIAEDALLTVELQYMQAELSLNRARIDLESNMNRLRTFLGFREGVEIELVISSEVPRFQVDPEEALNLALTQNPNVIAWQRQLLMAQRDVALARSQTGITMRFDLSYGMNKTAFSFSDVYSPQFSDRYGVGLQINVPILDWGQQRNRNRRVQSDLEIVETQIQQEEMDFRQDVYLRVMSFNMAENQLRIATLADTIAQRAYDIAFQRYLLGRGDITTLNIAEERKERARRDYMNALQRYWDLYYMMRRLTLFDFSNNRPLEADFDSIVWD